ncbi:hypothetical protein HD806DRAFT_93825 [Xylariaceae sp. AK1471]|nr:hypothetical protein HD806DRAFT_93825 [Xylariaceae sp. AK1471]
MRTDATYYHLLYFVLLSLSLMLSRNVVIRKYLSCLQILSWDSHQPSLTRPHARLRLSRVWLSPDDYYRWPLSLSDGTTSHLLPTRVLVGFPPIAALTY